MHYLALSEGADPWHNPVAFLGERRIWLRQFVAERAVQTNEVQRSWPLLLVFLLLAQQAGPQLELLELGPSAGLNLVWDRYRYRDAEGEWGTPDAALELTDDELAPIPGDLLTQEVDVSRRRGIDLSPVDVATEEGARLLGVSSGPTSHSGWSGCGARST